MRLLALLSLLPGLVFAQVPHTFNNGEVADANKINQNFEAIDQTGPEVTIGPLYDQITGVGATVDIEMRDDSGVVYWARGYPNQPGTTNNFLRDAPTNFSTSQFINLGVNEDLDFVIIVADMKGNKTIAKQNYKGPTTNIKQGIYQTDTPITWPYSPCFGEENELEYLSIGLGIPQESAWPTLGLYASLCSYVGSWSVGGPLSCLDGSQNVFFPVQQQLVGPDTFEVVGPAPYSGTSQLLFSTDSSQVDLIYSGSVDCSNVDSGLGVITIGPYQATFYRVDQ